MSEMVRQEVSSATNLNATPVIDQSVCRDLSTVQSEVCVTCKQADYIKLLWVSLQLNSVDEVMRHRSTAPEMNQTRERF